MESLAAPRRIGRYAMFGAIASGGMATVHFGWVAGSGGFGRVVAIKALHPELARVPEQAAALMDEARLAARLHHPNVARTLDVVRDDGELLLVMEYVAGAPLSLLLGRAFARGAAVDPKIAVAIGSAILHGLHAAHEAKDERGAPLGLVHRDVSPQNVLVGIDGVPRLVDFGVAKAAGRLQTTREGQLKGKLAYMAPEQIHGGAVDRRTDLFAASVVLWEMLAGERLFAGTDEADALARRAQPVRPPSALGGDAVRPFDDVLLRGLEAEARRRFPTARDMARALEQCAPMATASELGEWVSALAADVIEARAAETARIEAVSSRAPSRVTLASAPPPPRRKRRAIAWVTGAAVALAGAAGIGVARQRPAPDPVASTSAPATSEPLAPMTRAAPAAIETAAPLANPLVDQTAVTAAHATASPKAPRAVPIAPISTARPRAAAHARDCTPPYTVDANGFKTYKLGCL